MGEGHGEGIGQGWGGERLGLRVGGGIRKGGLIVV